MHIKNIKKNASFKIKNAFSKRILNKKNAFKMHFINAFKKAILKDAFFFLKECFLNNNVSNIK